MNLERWLDNIAVRKKPQFGREGVCPICGEDWSVFPVSGFYACPDCVKRTLLKRSQVEIAIAGAPVECDLCHRQMVGFVFRVKPISICMKCMWLKLGRKSRRMSIFGTRMV